MTGDRTAFIGHYACSQHDTGWNHPDHQGRLPALSRAVYRDMLTLFDHLAEIEAQPASEEDLHLAHTAGYVGRVRQRSEEAAVAGRTLELEDVPISGATWEAAWAASGAVLTGVEAVLAGEVRNAFAAVRPPGHGARADRAEGFSVFNHVAIGARHLRVRRGLERVLVVEWGARAGEGTAEIVVDDPGIRFLTLHQGTDPPCDWPDGVRAVPLPAGTTGAAYLQAFETALAEVVAGFTPEFILLSAGFDALAADPLGGLALQPQDYYALTQALRERAELLCAGRLVSVLEGGYDASATGQAVVQHLRALAGLPPA